MLDLFVQEDFLDAAACDALLAELRAASGAPATVYGHRDGGAVEQRVRRTTRIAVPLDLERRILGALDEQREMICTRFGVPLTAIEEPQFLRYREGDFFVAHQDGNTPLLLIDQARIRRISVVVFVSDPADYEGGELVFHGTKGERWPQRPRAGTLVAFRSETTHEVTPVTRGERVTIVSWYR